MDKKKSRDEMVSGVMFLAKLEKRKGCNKFEQEILDE